MGCWFWVRGTVGVSNKPPPSLLGDTEKGKIKKTPQDGKEVGSPSAAAQPRPKHGAQPEEPGCLGCAPSLPETAKTSPKTRPTHSGLMLGPTSVSAMKMGCSTCLRRGPGANSITRAKSSQPLRCPSSPTARLGTCRSPTGSCLAFKN